MPIFIFSPVSAAGGRASPTFTFAVSKPNVCLKRALITENRWEEPRAVLILEFLIKSSAAPQKSTDIFISLRQFFKAILPSLTVGYLIRH